MAQKSKKSLYIGIAIVTIAIVVSIIVYYYMIVRPKNQPNDEPKDEVEPMPSSVGTSAGSTIKPAGLTNTTLLEWKSPLMKGDRVQWVQNAYNKYALARKKAGKTPDWPIINEDGVFGENTHKAVNRVMGKYKTTWVEFKQRIDYLTSQL